MLQRQSFLARVSFLTITVLTIALLAPPMQAGNEGYSYARIVRLSLVRGDVQVARSGDSKWEPALMNMPIQQGFALGSNEGVAEIELENGSTVWLGEKSLLQFTELALSDGGRITKLTLAEGTATFYANGGAADSFGVSTTAFQITSALKSEFRVDTIRNGASVSVIKGKVSVSSPAGTKDLEHGDTFALDTKKPADAVVKQNVKTDDWDKWVKSRSSLLESGQNQTVQYTNAPFSYGMADLSSYGSWTFFPGFGYGWQPFGISSGWAPFSAGQWRFYSGLGLTWLSAEPWGWVPYHFGQWAYSPAFGWMWMPGGYGFWSAAPVQWMAVGNRVGWVPANALALTGTNSSTGTASVPVVVATKDLGKGGVNRVLTGRQAVGKFELLSTPPMPGGHGNAALAGHAPFVVPTAANLQTLRTSVAFDAQQRRFVNTGTTPGAPPLQPVAMNGMPSAMKPPHSLPPARTLLGSSLMESGFNHTGGASSLTPGHATGSGSSSGGAAVHSSGGGKPVR